MDGVTRRGFLGAMLASAMAPAVVRAGSIMRIKPLVLPGEAEFEEVAAVTGNRAISPDMFTREALKILNENLRFSATLNRGWDKRESGIVVPVKIRRPSAWMA